MKFRIEFHPKNVCIGVHVEKPDFPYWGYWNVWICFLGCCLHAWWPVRDNEEPFAFWEGEREILEGKGIPWEEVKKELDNDERA